MFANKLKGALAAAACALAFGGQAFADAPKAVAVPPGDLATALKSISKQVGVELLFDMHQLQGVRTNGVNGTFTSEAAVRKLLEGTDLELSTDESTGAMMIGTKTPRASTTLSAPPELRSENGASHLTLAQSASGDAPAQEAELQSKPRDSALDEGIQEILVTAQKRSEKLSDVPASISVLSADQMLRNSLTSLSDYANYVPGLSVQSGGSPGQARIVLRGINTNDVGQPPLVGVYIDESPVGSSTGGVRSASYAVDLMPYDIERVEVLRGPQGTLYGAATMGGLLKYVLREPNLESFGAQAGSDVQTVDGASGVGWAARAAVSGPIVTDKFGVRLSGFRNETPGYVDNIGLNRRDQNDYRSEGGRLAVLWRPTEAIKVKAAAMLQESESTGQTKVTFSQISSQPVYEDYTVSTQRPEPFDTRLQYYSLTADWDVGFASLISATSLMSKRDRLSSDSSSFSYAIPLVTGGAFAPAPISADLHFELKDKWTQELRLASSGQHRTQWQVGFFYTDEDAYNHQYFHPFDTAGRPLDNYPLLIDAVTPSSYRESAGFADVTFKITDRLDIDGGLRYAHNTQVLDSSIDGVLIGRTHVVTPSSDNVVTWSASSRFRLNPDAMIYVRAASGYRPGGANFFPNTPTYGPDTLINYEAGFKGSLLGGRMQLDASVFHIDWSDLQVTQRDPRGFIYTGNGGKAISRGAEMSGAYRVLRDLRIGGTLAFTDAHLTTDAPGIGGLAGDRLPGSSRWAGSLTADYSRLIGQQWSVVFGGSYSYRGEIKATVQTNAPVTPPMDERVDLYVGAESNDLSVRLYVKNALGERSFSQAFGTALPFYYAIPDPPRMLGISVNAEF